MFNGKRMRARRESLSLTRAELARRVEESESRLGQWERGEHEPRASAIVKIAQALAVSTDYLLGNTTDEPGGPVVPVQEPPPIQPTGESAGTAARRRAQRGKPKAKRPPRPPA
jgi:transcriptional regulator with XRE-family HTH domain